MTPSVQSEVTHLAMCIHRKTVSLRLEQYKDGFSVGLGTRMGSLVHEAYNEAT